MDLELLLDTLESWALINADILEVDDHQKIYKQILKIKLQQAVDKKLKEWFDYIDDMVDTANGQSPQECGLDPRHNIEEIIKDLQNL